MKRRMSKGKRFDQRHAALADRVRWAHVGGAMRMLVGLGVSMTAGMAVAQSAVTMYGLVDLGVEGSRHGGGANYRMIAGGSAGSRLGFAGAEDLGGGLKATFKLEQGFTPDNGMLAQGGRAFGREASVGLSSSTLGSFTMGRLPLPYYFALNGIDAFSWVGSGGMLSLTQNGATSRQLLPMAVNARADNAVAYTSPNWGGLEFRLLGAFAEKSATIGRAYSASARYRSGPIDALAAWARQNGASNDNGAVTAYTAGGNYNFGLAKLYVGVVNEKNSCTTCPGALARTAGVTGNRASEFRMTNVGVRVPLGAWATFAQVTRVQDRSQYDVDPGGRDSTWHAIGAEYYMSKRTMLYGTFATIGNKNGSNYALGSGTSQQPANVVAQGNPRASTVAIGLRHAF